MKAHDVRYLRICPHCKKLGDGREMLRTEEGLLHDSCAVATMSHEQILELTQSERNKIRILVAGPVLMRKLVDAARREDEQSVENLNE